MSYYSMYYIVTALFRKTGIKCENHSAAIILLKELFDINNNQISFAKKERVDKQYDIKFKINKEEAEKIIKIAEKFNAKINDFIENLNSRQISICRKELISKIRPNENRNI